MWRALTRLPSLVTELIVLTRESNNLQRELLALLGRPAQTPMTPPSLSLHPLVTATRSQQATRKPRIYTDRDVSFHTREDDLTLQEQRRAALDPTRPPLQENSRPSTRTDLGQRSPRPDPADEGDELLHP